MKNDREISLLTTARAELLLHGWRRQFYGTPKGPKCAAGALLFALCGSPTGAPGYSPAGPEAIRLNMRLVSVMTPEEKIITHTPAAPTGHLTHYNDYTAKSRKDIINLFDRAIEHLHLAEPL